MPSQNACSAKSVVNIFSNEGAGVYIFVVLIAYFSTFCPIQK